MIGKSFDDVILMLGKIDLLYDKKDTAQNFSIQYLTGRTVYIQFERLDITFESGRVVKVEKDYD